MIAPANAIVPKKTAPPLPTCLTRKSDVDSPTPVVRTFVSQKMAVTSGTFVSSVECRVFGVMYRPRIVDQWSWLEDLGQRQPPVRVGDRDEANMKVLACLARPDQVIGSAKSQSGPFVSSAGTVAERLANLPMLIDPPARRLLDRVTASVC